MNWDRKRELPGLSGNLRAQRWVSGGEGPTGTVEQEPEEAGFG